MSDKQKVTRIAVAMSGASGAVYGMRVLEELLKHPAHEVHLTVSPSAAQVLRVEHDRHLNLQDFDPAVLGLERSDRLHYHHYENVAAPLASGSFKLQAMVIVPCSMGCVAKIANGISGDLIERAADVAIKERRRLLVVPRETPLSAIHLENLSKLARLGVTVLPASPGFYGRPECVEDMVDFVVARILDHLDVSHTLGPRWAGG